MRARFVALVAVISVALAGVASACSSETRDAFGPPDAGVDGSKGREASTSGKPGPPDPDPEAPDADADAGDDDAEALGDAGGDAHKDAAGPLKRVFVTKSRYTGDLKTAGGGLDGLDGADTLCLKAAQAANMGGKWRAWLSTSTVDALSRIDDVGPWLLVDETTRVFSGKGQLATTPSNAISKNETGSTSVVGTVQRTWTGTLVGGTKASANCGDWTSTAGSGGVGVFTEKSASWTRYAIDPSDSCANEAPIYCFEQ